MLNAPVKEELHNLIYSLILQTCINFKDVCKTFAAWNWAL